MRAYFNTYYMLHDVVILYYINIIIWHEYPHGY